MGRIQEWELQEVFSQLKVINMQKLILNKGNGLVQVTTEDERWYAIQDNDNVTGLPTYRFIPSVTWICGYYPKGIAFYKWLASKGWDESQAQKNAAGDKGSKIHLAIEDLIRGKTVKMNSKYPNKSTGRDEELTTEEYEAVLSFAAWVAKVKPVFLHTEITVISKKYGFAGTVDCVAMIGGVIYIIDWKSSQYVWPEMEIQVSAYKEPLIEMGIVDESVKLAILQVGYKKNRAGFKWNEIEPKLPLFLAAKTIWEHETSGQKPSQKDYPISIKLKVDEPKVKAKKSKV